MDDNGGIVVSSIEITLIPLMEAHWKFWVCVGLFIGLIAGIWATLLLKPDTIITIKEICPTSLPAVVVP